MAEQDVAQQPPPLAEIVAAILARMVDPTNAKKLQTLVYSTRLESAKDAVELGFAAQAAVAGKMVSILVKALNQADPVYDEIAKSAVDGLFGEGPRGSSSSENLAGTVAAKIMGAIAPAGGTLEPGAEPSLRYLNVVTRMAIEGWLQGLIVEAASEAMPLVGGIETFADLDNTLADALGLSRLTRRVLSPFIDATAVTPAEWHVNRTYRHKLLAPGEVARQVARGRMTREEGIEELARQGYSDKRIEALLNTQRKFFGASDVRTFVDREHWSRDAGLQHLRDQGYDEPAAVDALRLEGLRRIEQLERDQANAIINAYVAGDISRSEMVGTLADTVSSAAERNLLALEADMRFGVSQKHLSPAETRAAVKAGILAIADYRRSLQRARYSDDAIVVLELLLRAELDADHELTEKRAAAAAAKAALLAARETERQAKQAAIEAQRAIERRGDEADLEAAAIRGLIPLARVEEVYAARYDDDTVGVYMALLEDKRQEYLEAERRRDEAVKRAARRQIGVGDLERAVLTNVLTLDQYRSELRVRDFDAGDVEILTRTLEARKRAHDAAQQAHADAAAEAKGRGIDLGRFERLVRRGVRTMEQYTALLRSLKFNEAAIAAMVELLDLEIADDQVAAGVRRDEAGRLSATGLTLEEFRRAVLLGVKTRDDYQRFLLEQRLTTDRQLLLLAELDAAIADAEAARQRRDAADARLDPRALPLASVRRAARLGIVSIDTYAERLAREGYDDEAIELELALLLAELADVQAARTVRDDVDRAVPATELTLGELARAVKKGLKTLDDFRGRASALGLSQDAIATQLRILGDEIDETQIAAVRREALGVELEGRKVPLAELEAAVIGGALTIAGFVEQLALHGLAPEDAELLGGILADALETGAAAPS